MDLAAGKREVAVGDGLQVSFTTDLARCIS